MEVWVIERCEVKGYEIERKIYPKLSGAGQNLTVRSSPVCNPLPWRENEDANVRCFIYYI